MRSAMREATDRLYWNDVPRSPTAMWPTQRRYCTGSGWSSPNSLVLASISGPESPMRSGGTREARGPPGAAWLSENNATDTTSSTSTIVVNRVRT